MSEGKFGKGDHVAYFDLFRLENNQVVEHWDVIQTIPPKSEWKNNNGKF
jgi:predicted SnoaL-like aldol condensation-catalyzing enzyme